jgi:hypothetical protein
VTTQPETHSTTRRRALLAAAGIAGTAAVTAAAPAQADTTTADWFDVKAYGAVGDGSTDDTQFVQDAINAAAAAKGGIVFFPPGTYKVYPRMRTTTLSGAGAVALTVPSNVSLRGSNQNASILLKGASGILLSLSGSGPSTDTSSSTHTMFASISDLGLFGTGSLTGLLLELYYCSAITVRDVQLQNNNDTCVDLVECWDSRFYNVTVGGCSGAAGSTSQPAMRIRSSGNASSTVWGYSLDNTNQIHLLNCRFEAFGTGALSIGHGANTGATGSPVNGVNGIYLTDCKFESSSIQSSVSFVSVDSTSRSVHATDIYCYADNLGATAPAGTTAPSMIIWQGQQSSLSNVLIANGTSSASIASGVVLYAPAQDTAVLRNVVGKYKLALTGAHIWQASSAGAFSYDNCTATLDTSTGTVTLTPVNGAAPAVFAPGTALPQINGAVSDASFATLPANGTMAVNTAAKTLCIRVNGSWVSTPLV